MKLIQNAAVLIDSIPSLHSTIKIHLPFPLLASSPILLTNFIFHSDKNFALSEDYLAL